MAQLSRLAQLYLKISDNLTEDDVRNLRSLLSLDEILGKAKVEKATPLEIFNMLVDNNTIGKGNLGLLVQILRCLGKGKLANEVERLEQEHEIEARGIENTNSDGSDDAQTTPKEGYSAATVSRDSSAEETEVKEIISVQNPPAATPENQQTTEAPEDTDVHCVTSELASLHIRELVRLTDEPMKTPGLGPGETDASTDDAKERLGTLLAELDTPAVMADQEKQFDLYCQIGDLYRAKLYNLQSALQYYQSMLECSKSLSEDIKLAKAHNRLGLTYDMLRKHEEAIKSHDRVVDICKVVVGDEVDICVAYKNLASSLTLSGKVREAQSNYKTALRVARETKNQAEEMNIYCMLGDLHKKQLKEPQISHIYYTNMLALAKDLRRKYWEMLAYNRLGNVCSDMQKNDLALQWYQKALEMSREYADSRGQIIAHMNVGVLQGKVTQTTTHLDTALQIAEQKQKEEYGRMWVYINMGDMQRERFNSPRTAIQYYEQYLALARQLGDRRQEGTAYNRLGIAYIDIREYEVALEWHQKQLKISQENEDKKEEITAHVAVGNAYRFLGKIEQATCQFSIALELAQQREDEQGQLRVYISMGDIQKDQFRSPRTSIQYYEKYLALARQLNNSTEEAFAYERLGLAQYEMGEYEKAVKWHQKHLDKSQDNGDNKQQITAHTNLGRVYRLLGSQDKATTHISTALKLAEQTGNLHGRMDVNLTMGDMQREQLHSPRTAIQYYEQHLALARQLGNRYKERLSYNKLGLAHFKMREYETALEWHQKHLTASQEGGDKKEQITALSNVGDTYRLQGKLDQAKSHFDTALQMAQQTEDLHGQMDVYCKMGDMQKNQLHSPRTAIQYYEQCLTLARKLGDMYNERLFYNKLGLTHFKMREYDKAMEWHQKYLKASQEGGDKKEQITALWNVGDTYRLLGELDQATSHFDTALQMAQQTGDQHGQMQVYFYIGDMQKEQVQSPRISLKYYEQALALGRQLGDRKEEGVAYNRLGMAHFDMGEHEKALEWFQQYLRMSQDSGYKLEEITAHTGVGRAFGALGKMKEATSHFDTALEIAQQTGDLYKEVEVYFSMGEMQREELRSPRSSIQYYEKTLALARQLGDQHEEAVAYNKLGLAHFEMREYETALEWHQKTLKTCQEYGDKKQQIAAQTCLGDTLRKMDKVDQATSEYDTALQMAQQTEDRHGQMRVYCKMGDLQMEQLHSPRKAIQYYEQALALARQVGDKYGELVAYNRLGLAHSELRKYETALEWHQKYLKASQESGDKKEQVTALRNVGNAYRLLGKVEEAKSHFDTALEMTEQTGDLHGRMEVYLSMGDMQREQLHSPRTAIQYYEQYLTLARQLGDMFQERMAYKRLGQAHSELRKYETVLEWYQKDLKASQEGGDKKEQITALRNVGDAYRLLGKVEEAKSHFDTALQMAQQTGDQRGQMDVYCAMGDLQRDQLHSSRTAIQYYEQYLALARQLEDRHEEGVAYSRLGQAHYEMGEYEKALEWHQKELKAGQESGDKKEQITAFRNVGNTYRLLGKLDQAKSHFDTALQMAQQTGSGDLHGQMQVYFSMGEMQREQLHSPRTAIQYYDQYLALARQLGDRYEEGVACKKMGLVHDDMREHETALEWFQQYLKVSQESGYKGEEITAHTVVGKAYGALGKVDEATSHFGTALKMSQETGNQYKEMEVCFYMGEMHREQLHSPRTAIQYYEQYLALAKQLGDRHEEEVAYNTLGQAHYEMEEYQVALDWFQKGLKSSQESGNMTNQIAINMNIASCHQKLSNLN